MGLGERVSAYMSHESVDADGSTITAVHELKDEQLNMKLCRPRACRARARAAASLSTPARRALATPPHERTTHVTREFVYLFISYVLINTNNSNTNKSQNS